jgi:hypothetical protein
MAMVSVKIDELSGLALDYAVAVCEGHLGWESTDDDEYPFDGHFTERKGVYFYGSLATLKYSRDWSLAGPIIEREAICIVQGFYRQKQNDGVRAYVCRVDSHTPTGASTIEARGSTPLIAAMRCYVASKAEGDSVMIPEELI